MGTFKFTVEATRERFMERSLHEVLDYYIAADTRDQAHSYVLNLLYNGGWKVCSVKGEEIIFVDIRKSYYIYEDEDGEQVTVNKEGWEVWPFFREVAAAIAMSDCTEQKIIKIVFQGREFHYAGWAPGMEYTFIDNEDPENTYTTYMEHLDH